MPLLVIYAVSILPWWLTRPLSTALLIFSPKCPTRLKTADPIRNETKSVILTHCAFSLCLSAANCAVRYAHNCVLLLLLLQ